VPTPTPAALLLDLDGTLVDSEPLHRAAYRSFFAARGWAYDEETLSLFTGRRADDVFATEPGPWSGEPPAALHDEVLGHLDPDRLPEPVPGVVELVDAVAAAGVPLAVVTSAGPDWVAATVDRLLGVRERFEVVVTRDDVEDGKPHPAGYRLACRRLGVDPAWSVAVEDSPAGVTAAVAAGVGRVYGVTTTWPGEVLDEAGATGVVPDLHPLVALFR
jgi:sugar-phosphatase